MVIALEIGTSSSDLWDEGEDAAQKLTEANSVKKEAETEPTIRAVSNKVNSCLLRTFTSLNSSFIVLLIVIIGFKYIITYWKNYSCGRDVI